MVKIIPRIIGGLGNQLFIYAAARRMAIVNNAELDLDNVSGFAYYYKYRRSYQLDHFNIQSRKATREERFEPFSRIRRSLYRYWNQRLPFEQRQYIVQEGVDFDSRLLTIRPSGIVYIEGNWQSEEYFKDIELQIRKDLKIQAPNDILKQMATKIDLLNTVRDSWFGILFS